MSNIMAQRAALPRESPTSIFIDLENILGTERSRDAVHAAWAALTTKVPMRERDHIVVASGPVLARVAMFELPLGRITYKVRAGIDGADRALLDQFDAAWLSRTFGRFIICSGDNAFAGVAREAARRGLEVIQLLGRGSPSAELSRACHRQERLDLAA